LVTAREPGTHRQTKSSQRENVSPRCQHVEQSIQGVIMSADSGGLVIRCPHCGQDVQLDEAITHQLAAPLRARWEGEIRQQVGADYAQDLADQTKKRQELEEQVKEQDSKIRELQDKETRLLKATRELEDDKAAWDLEQERMRAEISKEEREKAAKLANERA